MKKAFSSLLKFTVIIILLIAAALVALICFVHPNQFKPLIIEQVKKQTGREMQINGDLAWSFFPNLGIKVGQGKIQNPAGFPEEAFAEWMDANVSIKLWPLLHGTVEASQITLDGLTLRLRKNKQGVSNWQDLQKNPQAAPTTRENEIAPQQAKKKWNIEFSVPKLNLSDLHLIWRNEQTKQFADINHFNLQASDINSSQPFPLHCQFDYRLENPNLLGALSLDGRVKLNLAANKYSFTDIQLVLQTQQHKQEVKILINGDLLADLAQQTLQFDHFKGKVANLELQGQVAVNHLQDQPQASGHLQALPFDLKQWIKLVGMDNPSLQMAKPVSAEFDFRASQVATSQNPYAALTGVKLKGFTKVDDLRAANLHLQEVKLNLQMQNGILELTPITATFYQGNLKSNAKVDFNSALPRVFLQADLNNVNAETLLADLQGAEKKLQLSGIANISLQLNSSGLAKDAFLNNLNGDARFNFVDGKVKGFNLNSMVDNANATLQGQSLNQSRTDNATDFGNLTGTALIRNGIVNNDDLLLDSPGFTTRGRGSIDLVRQTLDYQLSTTSKQAQENKAKNIRNLYNLTIPITISGTFDNPKVNLDMRSLSEQIAKQQFDNAKDKIKDKIKDQLNGQLPGDLLDSILGG